MPESYVERQLCNYQPGVRGTNPKDSFGEQMQPMAMMLQSGEAIKDVAAYASGLPAT